MKIIFIGLGIIAMALVFVFFLFALATMIPEIIEALDEVEAWLKERKDGKE